MVVVVFCVPLLQAGAAPASTPMVVVEGAVLQAAAAPVSTPMVVVEGAVLQASRRTAVGVFFIRFLDRA